jgi:tetratricopeptide (TPR) repeat protein
MRSKFRKLAILSFGISVVVITTIVFHSTQSFYMNSVRGIRCFRGERYQLAISYLTIAHQQKPNDLEIARYLVYSYDQLGNKEKVVELLEIINARQHDVTLQHWLAGTYFGLGELEKAEVLYKRLLDSENKEAYVKYAEVLVAQKKYKKAIAVLDGVVRDYWQDLEMVEFLADVYSWDKQFDNSVTYYRLLLSSEMEGREKEISLKLADTLRYAGRDEEAVEIYSQLVKGGG